MKLSSTSPLAFNGKWDIPRAPILEYRRGHRECLSNYVFGPVDIDKDSACGSDADSPRPLHMGDVTRRHGPKGDLWKGVRERCRKNNMNGQRGAVRKQDIAGPAITVLRESQGR